MQLTLWSYEGPPHIGAMRIATAMHGVHYVLHAPQGDTYADLLFTMIERRDRRPPVTYTTFQARDLGGDTAALFRTAVRDAYDRFRPEAMIVGASCTAELIQDDPGGLAAGLGLPIPVIPVELPAYQRKENWGAAETFYQLVRTATAGQAPPDRAAQPFCVNILGPTALGLRHRDDVRDIAALLARLGIAVNVIAPLGASFADLARLPAAHANLVLYPETAGTAAAYLARRFGQKTIATVPIGLGATRDFVAEIAGLAQVTPPPGLAEECRLGWYARSVDSTYLTGKRVFIFGDATHAIALARVATAEIGFSLVGLGTYSREFAAPVRAAAQSHGIEALISDDYLAVEAAIAAAQPELVLGTQMERHIAKRLGVPCAVISAPAHVQDFPARHAPFAGFEGANVLFDTLIHPLMMGLEEHLLGMFRDDFEFNDTAAPSHLGPHATTPPEPASPAPALADTLASAPVWRDDASAPVWRDDAEAELRKIPFFVRGKARRNTEIFARERGLNPITIETIYDAKAHFSA